VEEIDQAYDHSEVKNYIHNNKKKNQCFFKSYCRKVSTDIKSFFCISLVEAVFLVRWKYFCCFCIQLKVLGFNSSLIILTVMEREGRNNAYNISSKLYRKNMYHKD